MFSNVRQQYFGGFKLPSMFQAVLGNAKVASRMPEGWLKTFEMVEGAEGVFKRCFNVLSWCLKVKVF